MISIKNIEAWMDALHSIWLIIIFGSLIIMVSAAGGYAQDQPGVDMKVDDTASSHLVETHQKEIEKGADSSFGCDSLTRIRYNNPGLEVDLGVGLWAVPFPVDFDDDGRHELLVGSGGKPYNGIYLFKGSSDEKGPVRFRPGVRLSASTARYNMQLSQIGDSWGITEPGKVYPDYKNTLLKNGRPIPYEPDFHIGRANQWRYFDYNGDGKRDLIIGASDWRAYRWDDAYNESGEWLNGPLRAYVYWVENNGTNENPVYGKARKVMAGAEPVEVYGMPSPNFADFNGDDLPDLILGEFLDKFTFFENTGTRTQPEYAPGRMLKYRGETLHMDLQMIQPSAVDWDGDGHVDLVVGDEDGRVAFLKNTGRVIDGMPEFLPPEYFRQEAEFVKFGALSTPYSTDWDGDSDEDIIAGNTAGYIGFIENLGGYPPKWAAPEYLEANGEVIRITAGENGSIQGPAEAKWGYTVLSAGDWNGDGLSDLVVNSIWGKIVWFENVGTPSKPQLAAAKPITVQWQEENPKPRWNWWDPEGNELVTQWRSSPQVIDLNKDGLMDLVAMDQEGFLAFFERYEQDGVPRLKPPKRIFHVEKNAPAVFDAGHDPVVFGGEPGSRNGARYDESGNLLYLGRTRRAVEPRTLSSIYRVEGIPQYVENEQKRTGELHPLRLNAGWAGMSGRRKFHLVDWTDNGQLDLIVNSGSNADLMENISDEPGEYLFKAAGPLDEYAIGGHTSNPVSVDWNRDGIRDLLIGAEDGFFYYKQNPRSQ